MNNPLHASSKRTFLGAVAVLALILGGFLVWRHMGPPIPAADVAAFLDRTAGSDPVRFSVVRMDTLRQDEAGLQVSVAATGRTLRPLYSKIDSADYLRRTFQLDPDSTAEARRLLADKSSAQKPEFTGAGPFPGDPYQATILQLNAPADSQFNFQGVIDAHRDGGAWSFSLVSGGFEGGGPQGQARSAFDGPVFIAGDAHDDAQLRVLTNDLQAFAGRVARIRQSSELARSAAVEERRKAFLAEIAAGRVFHGVAVEAGEQNGTALYLEILAVSAENEVTALLRNDGSWHNARPFQGAWSADDEFENPTLNLSSSADQAVRNAGPFLENTQNWTFALRTDQKGGLSEQNRFFQYRFQPLTPAQVSALRDRLEAEYERAIAATEPGLLYKGTASSRTSGASEPILLRFGGQADGGKSLEATIESTTRSWKRRLHGTILENARRSGGEPVRLRTSANEAAEDAPPESVLGDPEDLDLSFGPGKGSLIGEDGHFTYRLAVAGDSDLHRLDADAAQRARRFMEVLRNGIVYDGILREDQGFVTRARLEITRIDRKTGTLAASIHSLVRPNVYRDFLGTCDPSGGSMALGATSRGAFGSDDDFDVPFLKTASAATLHLALTGTSITGRIEGDPHWVMEFPAGVFLSATTESPEPNSPPANGSVFPPFPKADGAYLLSRGSWLALPRNNGHVVVETVSPKSDLELPSNIIGAVNAGIGELAKKKEKRKITYLEFDGKDPRPESSGAAVILLFVGPDPSGKPPAELAPAETMKEGQRRVKIMEGPPAEIRLGEQRLAAYVRHAAPGYLLFTTTSALAPGPYVFNADVGYELTQE